MIAKKRHYKEPEKTQYSVSKVSGELFRDLLKTRFTTAFHSLLRNMAGGGDLLNGFPHHFAFNNVLRLVVLQIKGADIVLRPAGTHCGQQSADGLTAAVHPAVTAFSSWGALALWVSWAVSLRF